MTRQVILAATLLSCFATPVLADPTTDEIATLSANVDRAAAAAEGEVDDIPDADKLRTPDSPAFVILGVAPTDIQKPTSPRELAVALSEFVDDDNNVSIPSNVAIEVAPYWWANRDALTFEAYQGGTWIQLVRNLSLSLATSGVEGADTRGLGFGFRTEIGWQPNELEKCKAADKDLVDLADATAIKLDKDAMTSVMQTGKHDDALSHTKQAIVATETDYPAALQALAGDFTDDEEPVHEMLVARIESARAALAVVTGDKSLNDRLSAVQKDCAAAASARKHVLSIAGAFRGTFANAAGDDGDFVSQEYWATYAYKAGKSASLLAVARLEWNEAKVGWDGFAALGARAIESRDDYAGSIEVIGRRQIKGEGAAGADLLLKVAVEAEYMIRDGKWLTLTFGKEFAAADAGSLFALANVSWSFGDPAVKTD